MQLKRCITGISFCIEFNLDMKLTTLHTTDLTTKFSRTLHFFSFSKHVSVLIIYL